MTDTREQGENEKVSRGLAVQVDDLRFLESGLRSEIESLEARVREIEVKLSATRKRLQQVQKQRFSKMNDIRNSPEEITDVLISILNESSSPFRLAEIRELFKDFTGIDMPKATLYNHLQKGKGTTFKLIGERGGGMWDINDAPVES